MILVLHQVMFQVLRLSVLEHFEQKNIWNIWMARCRKFVYKVLISIFNTFNFNSYIVLIMNRLWDDKLIKW